MMICQPVVADNLPAVRAFPQVAKDILSVIATRGRVSEELTDAKSRLKTLENSLTIADTYPTHIRNAHLALNARLSFAPGSVEIEDCAVSRQLFDAFWDSLQNVMTSLVEDARAKIPEARAAVEELQGRFDSMTRCVKNLKTLKDAPSE